LIGYQQNSLRTSPINGVDFEACFAVPTINSIAVPITDVTLALPMFETTRLDIVPEPILLRRLAETYRSYSPPCVRTR
jgi:hypothetical protein